MKKKTVFVIVLVIMVVIVCAIAGFWWYHMSKHGVGTAEIKFHVAKNDGNYTITIKEINKGTIDMQWDIMYFEAEVLNGSEQLMRVKLVDVLNNVASNITFYDKDNNGIVSIGDEFTIKGVLAEEGNIFRLCDSAGTAHIAYLE